jgi:hypothetical protein
LSRSEESIFTIRTGFPAFSSTPVVIKIVPQCLSA